MFRTLFIIVFIAVSYSCFAGNNTEALQWAKDKLEKMTIEEKIGQLFMITVESDKDLEYENRIEAFIRTNYIGGILFFEGDPIQQVEITNKLQQAAKYPLMVGLDAEHGVGWRLSSAIRYPRMLINGAITNDSLIFRLGAAIARHCKEVGVHVNFAPVADINSNPQNPVIGMRSFGEERDNVYQKDWMYIRGSLTENVLPVVKHFPGHGDTDTDSHQSLPFIKHSFAHIDSFEFYPFKKLIDAGIPSVMVGHLNVNALDSSNMPASLSPRIITYWLRDRLHFNGLCFTDALNMRGVTTIVPPGEAEVKAFLAGSDILLYPKDAELAVNSMRQAVADGRVAESDIDERCLKILAAKYKYVLPNYTTIRTDSLWSRLNKPEDIALKHELYKNAVTLIKNDHHLIPLKNIDSLRIASVNFGSEKINHFQTTLDNYANIQHFTIKDSLTEAQIDLFLEKVKSHNLILLYNNAANNKPSSQFGYSESLAYLIKQLKGKKIVLCHPGIPYGLKPYLHLPIDAVVINYEDDIYPNQYAAQLIFGGIPAKGVLPVSINDEYPAGWGINTPKTRLGYVTPEMQGISSQKLAAIDSICKYAISSGATPGCQVLIAKNNDVIYNKAFGYHTYEQKNANTPFNIYDIASVTKIAATMPAVMKLYDEKKMELDTPLSAYYPALIGTNKEKITLQEVLAHQSGLINFIPFFKNYVDTKQMNGKLFSYKPTKYTTTKLNDNLYVNPNFKFKANTIAFRPQSGFKQLALGVYVYNGLQDSILHSIIHSELNPKKEYAYSDIGFILLQKAIENITGEALDEYCINNFYKKLGAYHTNFVAAERLNPHLIIPSTVDNIYRKTELKGYVHDPTSFLLGGITGNAGLFSTANDLAKIMAMLLNDGTYGDERYIQASTIDLFGCQTNCYEKNRRGLGFDKPEFDPEKVSPACLTAHANSFGHSGYTGTIAWGDPDNQLIYIFLSNRTYPNEYNTKLIDSNIRTEIQKLVYEAIK